MTCFVFLHVGTDLSQPTLLVRSLLKLHPDCRIIQCSDDHTPAVTGATHVHRTEGDTSCLMTYRLAAFASLGLTETALYMDTDMLCLRAVDLPATLGAGDVAVCRREFDRDAAFNIRFRDMDLGQYAGMTLDQVYPYIACATITRDAGFWRECLAVLQGLDPKFHRWYGDQEAIREVVKRGRFKVRHLSESIFARLPDKPVAEGSEPSLLHFKGAARKPMMLDAARQLHLN